MPDLPAAPPPPRSGAATVAAGTPLSPIPTPRTAAEDLDGPVWDLTLYVAGATMSSARAISVVRQLCDVHLGQRHRLTVVDVSDDLDELPPMGVLAAPSLLRRHPLPERRWYGDLSDPGRLLAGLQIPTPADPPAADRVAG